MYFVCAWLDLLVRITHVVVGSSSLMCALLYTIPWYSMLMEIWVVSSFWHFHITSCCLHFFLAYTEEWNCVCMWLRMNSNCQIGLHSRCINFYFHPAVCESVCFSAFPSKLGIGLTTGWPENDQWLMWPGTNILPSQ